MFIGPDRTKKQQAHFHIFRDECEERRLKGERVIIVNDRIVVDKRPPLHHVGDVDATHQHKSHDKHSVDRRSPSPTRTRRQHEQHYQQRVNHNEHQSSPRQSSERLRGSVEDSRSPSHTRNIQTVSKQLNS